jgi:XTP/dITP diphosphohydrolase
MIFATKNRHKLIEAQKIFITGSVYDIFPMPEAIPEPEETGTTFIENALIKAFHTANYVDSPVIADDSGLEIDALNGAPGVFSARYAGKNATDIKNVEKILAELKNIPEQQRTARFHCVVVYLKNKDDKSPIICHAAWEGSILYKPQGNKGFGYDPIFYVPTHNCSAAELSPEIKNQISHRGQALNKLITNLNMHYNK